ncbi:hypothetical protein HPB48_010820 [Haemaphysalis longicornis]|uniref:Uncharacterized protein n=1 Tax=Haemaphysalis longicornis TaxID=44386 RepID=A0A9J6GX46_HAELO|nr:hypothetical protein HPB48_010820 [Haemaphysalis longicornis]
MTGERYADVIETVVLPYALDGPFPDGLYHFQQYGSSGHTARVVKERLESLGIPISDWPARTPDSNINVWGRMKKNLFMEPGLTTASPDQLWQAGKRGWNRLRDDPMVVDQVLQIPPPRIQWFNEVGGGATRYLVRQLLQAPLPSTVQCYPFPDTPFHPVSWFMTGAWVPLSMRQDCQRDYYK